MTALITETAIILAGGLGTRIKDTLGDLPKSMADINGKPLLAYILRNLKQQGISHIILAVGHRHEPILDYFGQNYEGMQVSYSVEEEPLGTGGAMKKAFSLAGPVAFVLNGDTYFDADLKSLYEQHVKSGAVISIALKPMKDFDRYATVQIDETGRIKGYKENQPTASGTISGGIYVIDRSVFENKDLGDKFSFETDIMESTYQELPFFGFSFDTYFIDVGIPQDYERAKDELTGIDH